MRAHTHEYVITIWLIVTDVYSFQTGVLLTLMPFSLGSHRAHIEFSTSENWYYTSICMQTILRNFQAFFKHDSYQCISKCLFSHGLTNQTITYMNFTVGFAYHISYMCHGYTKYNIWTSYWFDNAYCSLIRVFVQCKIVGLRNQHLASARNLFIVRSSWSGLEIMTT